MLDQFEVFEEDGAFVARSPDEGAAAAMKADSGRMMSAKLALKAHLMAEVVVWIEANDFGLAQAAQRLGVTTTRLSDLRDKEFAAFTIDALIDMLLKAGKHIGIAQITRLDARADENVGKH